MAVVSKTCNGSLGDYCKVYLEYKINNTESDRIARNKSNTTLHLYAQATDSSVGAYNFNNNCKAYLKINNVTKKSSTTLNMDFRNKQKVEMLTWTGDVEHDDEGKLKITISGNFDTNGPSSVTTGSVSKEWTLPTIPRASNVTCADGNIGSATTININRASTEFKHTLKYSFFDLSETIVEKTTESSIGWIIPISFYEKIQNTTSGIVTITCETYNGDTLLGTSETVANVFVINSNPTISATVEDTNASAITATGDKNKLIRYISDAKVVMEATPKNSATIKSLKVVNGSQSATTATSTINKVDSGKFVISCIDSRGLSSGDVPVDKTLIEYIKPVIISCELERENTTSDNVKVALRGQFFNGNFGVKTNTLTLKYRYKKVRETTWSDYITITATNNGNNFTYIATLGTLLSYKESYDIEFVASDYFESTTSDTYKGNVPNGEPIVDIGENDVIVNGQTYMKLDKILAFKITNGHNGCLIDNEGNEYYPKNEKYDNYENNISEVTNHTGIVKIGKTRIEYGRVENVNVPASGYNQYTINFSEEFASTPFICVQECGNYNIKCDVATKSSTNATINCRSNDNTERTDRWFDWFAIGKEQINE